MKDKAISKELYDLLYDVKALAIEQVPVSFNSLARSIEQLGYMVHFEKMAYNHFNLVITKSVKGSKYCDLICVIHLDYINNAEASIHGCKYNGVRELEYMIHKGILIPLIWEEVEEE